MESRFSEVIRACCLFLTIPVINLTTEQSFSNLKLIQNYFRTSMGQDRVSNLSLLLIDAENLEKLKSAMDNFINKFAEKKPEKCIFDWNCLVNLVPRSFSYEK